LPIWIAALALTILFFIIIENKNISYYFALSGIAFSLQLAGGMSSPLFVGYVPVLFLLHKRGLKLKLWWIILPLFSLFQTRVLVPYLLFYGSVVFLYFIKPQMIKKKILGKLGQSEEEGNDKGNRVEKIIPEHEIPATIPNKFYDSLSASLDIIVRMFKPFSVVLLIKEDERGRFKVHVTKGGGEIEKGVSIDKGPLSWYLQNSGVLVNNDFGNTSMNLCYYKNVENIEGFISSSIEFNKEVTGILVVDRNEKIPFEERDKELIVSIVKGLSTLFSLYSHINVSMLEAFRLRYLLNLTKRVAGDIKLEEVRKRIFETINDSFKDVWTIFLLKEGNEYHITEHISGKDERRYSRTLHKSIVASYLEKNLSFCKEDFTTEIKRPILFPEERDFGAKSLLFSPFKGDVRGGILLLSKNKDCFDRNKDLMILNLITDIASFAVEKAVLHERVRKQAVRDGLTNAFNHGFFQEILDNKIAEAQRNEESISLLMIDLDNFKMINDQFGHQNGDMILKNVGGLMKDSIRSSDILARYGGEEFAIILPKTISLEAYKIAEKLRISIENKEFVSPDGIKLKITISIGISEFFKHADNKRDLIAAADRALYLAKKEGKNCTFVAED
jgi:diguanylate cyclase (GGDEF)-like protein